MTFKQAIAKAKQIRKAHPKMKWTECVKQAWKGVKKSPAKKTARKKVSAIKIIERRETKKTPVKATYQVTRTKKGTVKKFEKVGGTIAGVRSHGLALLNEKYGRLAVQRLRATKVRDRNKYAKAMREVAAQIKKISSL